MPYQTKSGDCFHMTFGCHGAIDPYDPGKRKLRPCATCCVGSEGAGGTCGTETTASDAVIAFANGTQTDEDFERLAEELNARNTKSSAPGVTAEQLKEKFAAGQAKSGDSQDATASKEEPLAGNITAEDIRKSTEIAKAGADSMRTDYASMPLPSDVVKQLQSLPPEERIEALETCAAAILSPDVLSAASRQKTISKGQNDAERTILHQIRWESRKKTKKKEKGDNQYYGAMYETILAEAISGEEVDAETLERQEQIRREYREKSGKDFSSQDIAKMKLEATQAAAALRKAFPNIRNARVVGNHTKNEDGDLIVTSGDGNQHVVEVKHANGGLGTHLNTSANSIAKILDPPVPGDDMAAFQAACGSRYEMLPSYSDFLRDSGYYAELDAILGGNKVHFDNASPLTESEAKAVRSDVERHKRIEKTEIAYRHQYMQMMIAYMQCTGQTEKVARQCLSKEISGKRTAEVLLATDTKTGQSKAIRMDDVLDQCDPSKIETSGSTIKFGGFHCTLSWQNGVGLYNPTLRVFLDI